MLPFGGFNQQTRPFVCIIFIYEWLNAYRHTYIPNTFIHIYTYIHTYIHTCIKSIVSPTQFVNSCTYQSYHTQKHKYTRACLIYTNAHACIAYAYMDPWNFWISPAKLINRPFTNV